MRWRVGLSRALVTAALTVSAAPVLGAVWVAPSAADDCGDLPVTVTCGVGTDPSDGHFHGLIGVTGQDWVLDLASHAGNTAGCGDCVWTIELDCPQSSPTQPDPADCAGMQGGAGCPPDAMPFRLYLTTSSVTNEVVGRICLGGGRQVVLVGEDAAADVDRYVHAVAPPDLLVQHRPRGATLAGLPTFFTARVPAGTVGPVGFGGPTVTEAITLVPEQAVWEWGDGDTSDWMPVDATAVHRYLSSGAVAGTLTTRWGATYTATFEGRTVGPFRADGELERPQPFVERVRVSAPILVSRQADALPSG